MWPPVRRRVQKRDHAKKKTDIKIRPLASLGGSRLFRRVTLLPAVRNGGTDLPDGLDARSCDDLRNVRASHRHRSGRLHGRAGCRRWAAAKLLPRLQRPIRIYALLEVTIAIGALLVPWLLAVVGRVHVAMMGGQASPPSDGGMLNSLAGLGLGCVVLLIPTACMGATLPILARGVVHRSEQIGRRIGWLYGLNTVGAVAGVVLAAFFLIPNLGLWSTSFVGIGLNLLVAVFGWFVATRAPAYDEPEHPPARLPAGGAFTHLILAVMLVSGSVAFAYEVLWARLLAHVLGGSLYAFATMLAAFLAGIAIGGLVGARIASGRRISCYWLAGVQIGMGILTAITFSSIDSWSSAAFLAEELTMASQVTLCGLILMPTTLCLGATFPLAVRSLAEDPDTAGQFAGRVYSWNTVGAIVGAVGAGYS